MENSPDLPSSPADEWRSAFGLYRSMASITAIPAILLAVVLWFTMDEDAIYINGLVAGFIIVLLLVSTHIYRIGVREREWLYRWCRFKTPLEKAVDLISAELGEKGFVTAKSTTFPGFSINPWLPVARLDLEECSLGLEFSVIMAGSIGSVATMKTGPFIVMLQGLDDSNGKEAEEVMKTVDGLC